MLCPTHATPFLMPFLSHPTMGSEVAVVGELPQLPPLEMTAVDAAEHEECVTPRSEEPVLVCPPAPRKPRPPKRTLEIEDKDGTSTFPWPWPTMTQGKEEIPVDKPT
ncbi:hypothetical protein BHE74_00059489 [Ensete ventricosum]|nr:hypothetical protein BHE74_00059489 [Ensete ventricosum]RZS01318.1 hypothetical protein BHM03_00031167 [Ensete ventricosum]